MEGSHTSAVPAYLKNVRVKYAPPSTPGTLQDSDENDDSSIQPIVSPRARIPSVAMDENTASHVMRRRRPKPMSGRKKRHPPVLPFGSYNSSSATSPFPLSPRSPTDSDTETVPSTVGTACSTPAVVVPVSSPGERVHVLTDAELRERIEAEVRSRLLRELTNEQPGRTQASPRVRKRTATRCRSKVNMTVRKSPVVMSESDITSDDTESRHPRVEEEESVKSACSSSRKRSSMVEVVQNLPKRALFLPLLFTFTLTVCACVFSRYLEDPFQFALPSSSTIRFTFEELLALPPSSSTTTQVTRRTSGKVQYVSCAFNPRQLQLPGPESSSNSEPNTISTGEPEPVQPEPRRVVSFDKRSHHREVDATGAGNSVSFMPATICS